MSNNRSDQPQISASNVSRLFFAASFQGLKFAIRRNPNFMTTVASVRKAFPNLSSLNPSRIRLLAQFNEFGEDLIEIGEELWAEIMPTLMNIYVLVREDVSQSTESLRTDMPEIPIEDVGDSNPAGECEHATVHIRDTLGRVEDLILGLPLSMTTHDLKKLILRHTAQLPEYFILGCEGYSNLEADQQIRQYGIRNGSTVSIATEFEVHLNVAEDTRHSVTISTSATVHILRLLAFSYASENTGINHFRQMVMTCAGEVLTNNQVLGWYSQIVPGCRIEFNKFKPKTQPNYSSNQYMEIVIRRQDTPEPQESNDVIAKFTVLTGSTLLDLKLLILNKLHIPLSRQQLEIHYYTQSSSYYTSPIRATYDTFAFEYQSSYRSTPVGYLKELNVSAGENQ